MSYQPFVPTGGLAGWRFLQNTIGKQREVHGEGVALQRDLSYFREKIGKIDSAEELVGDYRLLSVALGAFGLSDDINSKFLIRRVLEEGTLEPDALSNKMSDKRYRDLSRAFGFGDFSTPNTKISDFADRIEARYKERVFETDLGKTNESMRLALNAQRELPALGAGSGSNRTKWFSLMGTPPLRKVMETALGMPASFGTMPIDTQLNEFIKRSEQVFGTSDMAELTKGDRLGRVLDRYTTLDGLANGGTTVTSPALMLLRGF